MSNILSIIKKLDRGILINLKKIYNILSAQNLLNCWDVNNGNFEEKNAAIDEKVILREYLLILLVLQSMQSMYADINNSFCRVQMKYTSRELHILIIITNYLNTIIPGDKYGLQV